MRSTDPNATDSSARSSRFVEADGAWFFRSREGIRFGGFASRFDAELAAYLLFTRVMQADSDSEVRTVMAEFVHSPPLPYAASPVAAVRRLPNARERRRSIGASFRRWLDGTPAFAH